MDLLKTFWQTTVGVFQSFQFSDLIDILIIAFLVYKLIQMVKETRSAQLVKGILLLVLAAFLSTILNLRTLNLILSNIFTWGLLAVIVLFQPEFRKMLERVGRAKVSKNFSLFSVSDEEDELAKRWSAAIQKIASSCEALARTKTGALLVFERQTRLGDQIETGVELNADVSEELLGNIFFKNSPLHDGAMILRDARILAAGCFLPKPQKEERISRSLGSRHRAAIGMSENSDAIVLVVSEETGCISIAENGRLIRRLNKTSLIEYLTEGIIPKKAEEARKKKFRRKKGE